MYKIDDNIYGMTKKETRAALDNHDLDWDEFAAWMEGQTMGMDEDGNLLFYEHDVDRYIELRIYHVPTYFD